MIIYTLQKQSIYDKMKKGDKVKKLKFLTIATAVMGTIMISVLSANATTTPSSYSSKDLGYCSSVKTQTGSTCWAYSTLSSFESLLLKNNLFTLDLDPSRLDLWATPESNGDGWQRQTGQAAYSYTALGYFTSWQGPYDTKGNKLNIGTTAIKYLDKNDPNTIKSAIMESGAVSTNYNAITSCTGSDGISFALTKEYSYISGHAISVVGWDDNYSKTKFDGSYTPTSNGAWLCKNSWGNYNSLEGYFWISYEDYYIFNEDIFGPSYAITDYQTINNNDYLYQNEIYGATYEFNYVANNDIVYFNVFDFTKNGNTLDKVIFETKSKGAYYSVYYVPVDDNDAPYKDKNLWIELESGTVDYRGYICCDFEDIVISQSKGAIAVEIDTFENNRFIFSNDPKYIKNGVGVSEWLVSASTSATIFTKQGIYGECYLMYNDKLYDVMDIYKDRLSDTVGGTFVIKAITNDTVNTKILGDVNFSQTINIKDATEIQKHLISMKNLIGDQLINADFNGDGCVNINDVTALQKYLANI